MTSPIKRQLVVGSLMSALGLMGCVSQSKYDDLEAQYQQLQQQNAAMSQQIAAAKT
jgi:outer membrane murein-binding lipoprotein Lpp